MLRDTLTAVKACTDVAAVTLVGDPAELSDIADEHGAALLDESALSLPDLASPRPASRVAAGPATMADARLNAVLRAAAAELHAHEPHIPVGVVHADLPALTPSALHDALAIMFEAHALTFVADRHGDGTTALFAPDVTTLRPQFGAGSARRHRDAGAFAAEHDNLAGLRLDVDTPADLADVLEYGAGAWTRAAADELSHAAAFTCNTPNV